MDTNDYYYLVLTTLSRIQEYDKLGIKIINNNEKLIVDKGNYSSFIRRYYNGYNRISVINYLKEFMTKLESYIDLLIKGKLIEYGEKLIPLLSSSNEGINHLINTYKDDSNIVSELRLFESKIQTFINNLKK